MTIIELPEEYHWEISKRIWHKEHEGDCDLQIGLRESEYCTQFEDRYVLAYRRVWTSEFCVGVTVKKVPGKHWWSKQVEKYTENFVTHTTDETVATTALPHEFDADVIRDAAWTMLYNLALKDPKNDPRNKFVGVYPPKTLD